MTCGILMSGNLIIAYTCNIKSLVRVIKRVLGEPCKISRTSFIQENYSKYVY